MKSSLKNMVLVLLLITLFASAAVAVVYKLTEEPIAQAKGAKTSAAIGEVVPAFDNDIASTATPVEIDGGQAIVYTAESGGQPVGYAIESFTTNGFSGLITLMVGFLPDGTIHGIQVLSHAETPGLGSKMADEGNPLTVSFVGKSPADLKMSVRKDGGDIDAITASTITSRAYTEAVDRAYRVFQAEVMGQAPQIHEVDPYQVIFPGYDNDPASEMTEHKHDTQAINIFRVRRAGELMGYMVYTHWEGFKSRLEMLVGFSPDGTILDILVTGQDETPGYGAEIVKQDNPLLLSFKGKSADALNMRLKTDGGDIDAITGSTITSDAYVKAVAKAWEILKPNLEHERSHE